MRVILVDDDDCTSGAQKYDVDEPGTNGTTYTIRQCRCNAGFYIEASDPLYCGSSTSCVVCPPGMVCTGEQRLNEVLLLPGSYRLGALSETVVECPIPDACAGTLLNLNTSEHFYTPEILSEIDQLLGALAAGEEKPPFSDDVYLVAFQATLQALPPTDDRLNSVIILFL